MQKQISHEITDRILLIGDSFVSFYLFKTRNSYLAIDTGQNPHRVKRELARWQLSPEKVIAVFLTHSDIDHTGGLPCFSQAKIFLSRQEEQMINGTTKRFFFKHNKGIPAYTCLRDGEETDIDGVSIRALLTPGHTPGSTSYLVENKYLFTGDALALKNNKAGLFMPVISMDNAAQRRSIRKLAEMDHLSCLLTAHHGYTLDPAGAFADWKDETMGLQK